MGLSLLSRVRAGLPPQSWLRNQPVWRQMVCTCVCVHEGIVKRVCTQLSSGKRWGVGANGSVTSLYHGFSPLCSMVYNAYVPQVFVVRSHVFSLAHDESPGVTV